MSQSVHRIETIILSSFQKVKSGWSNLWLLFSWLMTPGRPQKVIKHYTYKIEHELSAAGTKWPPFNRSSSSKPLSNQVMFFMEENWCLYTVQHLSLLPCVIVENRNIFDSPRTNFMFVFGYVFKLILKACFVSKAYNHRFRLNPVGICRINVEDCQ